MPLQAVRTLSLSFSGQMGGSHRDLAHQLSASFLTKSCLVGVFQAVQHLSCSNVLVCDRRSNRLLQPRLSQNLVLLMVQQCPLQVHGSNILLWSSKLYARRDHLSTQGIWWCCSQHLVCNPPPDAPLHYRSSFPLDRRGLDVQWNLMKTRNCLQMQSCLHLRYRAHYYQSLTKATLD